MSISPVYAATPTSQVQPFQEPSKGGRSLTTWKTHALVVLSYLLIGIGIALACASIYMATVFHPMIAVITPLGPLGAGVFIGQKVNAPMAIATSAQALIPGQPPGIRNSDEKGNMVNCWLIAAFLGTIFTASLKEVMEKLIKDTKHLSELPPNELPPYYDGILDLITAHKNYQMELQNPTSKISKIDIQKIRTWLYRNKKIALNSEHGEPNIFLEAIYKRSDISLPIVSTNNSKEKAQLINLFQDPDNLKTFQELFNGFFNNLDTSGKTYKCSFSHAPKGFFVDIVKGSENGKVKETLNIPSEIELTNEQCHAGHRKYYCNFFIKHLGSIPEKNGHYISYVLRNGEWWKINDEYVQQISEDEADQERQSATLIHYQQTTIPSA